MASKVDIVNMAFRLCHSSVVISDFDNDTGKGPVLARRFYDQALLECLELAHWGFATTQATLSTISGQTTSEWLYQYALPANIVSPQRLINVASPTTPIPYEIQLRANGTEKMLVTNEYEAILRYTKLVTTPTLYSPHFVSTLALNLAEKMCGPLTDDYKRVDRLSQMYNMQFNRAAALALEERRASDERLAPEASWIDVRS